MPLEHSAQLANPKSGLKSFVLAQLCFQLFRCGFCRLQRSRQRTTYNYITLHLETVEKFRPLPRLFFTKVRDRPFIIRLGPARPIGFAMSEEIELHVLDSHSEQSREIPYHNLQVVSQDVSTSLDMTDLISHRICHFALRVCGSVCQSRTPPRKAFRLCPSSIPSGS